MAIEIPLIIVVIIIIIINYIYSYLFIIRKPTPASGGSGRTNAKERVKKERHGRREKKRKGIEAQRADPSNPSREP